MADHGLEIDEVRRSFGRTTALDGVSLSVARGRVLGLLGPNGAGNPTTLVRVLATLLRPDAGTACVAGFDVRRERAEVRRRIALSGQHTSVDDELSGRANLVMIGRLLDLGRDGAARWAGELLSRFGLEDAADRPAAYSGGMRRRLDLAAALVGAPEVFFLDEPSTGLDPAKRDELWQIIRKLSQDGVTVLLTTQYLEAEAKILARGIGSCPGVATGRVATSPDEAARMAASGIPVILVRPETSPDDMRGLAAAGIVTARGGPASHAAVVARSMGRPAVVGVGALLFDPATGSATIADHPLTPETLLTIDRTSGDIAAGSPRILLSPAGPHLQRLLAWSDTLSARRPPGGSA